MPPFAEWLLRAAGFRLRTFPAIVQPPQLAPYFAQLGAEPPTTACAKLIQRIAFPDRRRSAEI